MTSQVLALVLVFVLGGNLSAQSGPPPDWRGQVSTLAIGTKMDVRLKGGETVKGRLVSSDENGFTIEMGRTKKTQRVIDFRDTERIATHKPSHTPAIAWIAVGAIVAVVVIVIVAIGIERHNEVG